MPAEQTSPGGRGDAPPDAAVDAVRALQAEVRGLRDRLDALTGQGERFSAFYPAFEDRFRGSEEEVRTRLAVHLPDVAGLPGRLLDVGPGRGEWLGLLRKHGIAAYGVEVNAAMVARLQADGLDVVVGDAIDHLTGLEPRSLGAVTAFHVIEHLDVEQLLDLLTAAHRALRPGGVLLLETPNPTNLVMGACNFYLDPTHRQPLPPALTEFLVTAAGFTAARIRPLHPKEPVTPASLQLAGLPGEVADLLARALHQAFFGPQDYAVVAVA